MFYMIFGGFYRMLKFKAPLGVLFFAVLARPLPSATLNFLVAETGSVRESSAGEGPSPVSPAFFESSALWEACLFDVFFEAGHVASNSPILQLAGAAGFPGGNSPGGEFPREIRAELEEAILGGADYFILVLLSYPPGADPGAKPEGVNLKVYSLRSGEGGNRALNGGGFVYEGGASSEDPPEKAAPGDRPAGPAGGEAERNRAKRLIRGLIPYIKD
jgi:hypothetical protein